MKKVCSVLYALFVICCIAIAQTTKDKIAVYVTGDAQTGYKKVVGSKIVTAITKSNNYSAVERTSDFLVELAKEQEYQMSGAVSDDQIVRIGQQFGVRYVLIADVSEVLGSIFISARMINVQTGQIFNSVEADAIVNRMDDLTLLSEKIIILILDNNTLDIFKVVGPFNSAKDLGDNYMPFETEGHHFRCAQKDEVVNYIKKQQLLGESISLPVYADISRSYETRTQYYKVYQYSGTNTRQGRKTRQIDNLDRTFLVWTVKGAFIQGVNSITSFEGHHCNDDRYYSNYSTFNYPETERKCGAYTVGLFDMSCNDDLISGYIYFVQEEK